MWRVPKNTTTTKSFSFGRPGVNQLNFKFELKNQVFDSFLVNTGDRDFYSSITLRLRILCDQVSFGCVLNDTTMTKAVRITNNSVVDCAFSWSFLEDVEEGRLSATARRPYIPVNQIFDILPIRSFLRPGESEEVRAWDCRDLCAFW